ncbi:hypothetical protein NPS29_26800, partial [Pseudomonas putida]|uniref:hypothetical protein n=1 Tax=Pseudomonas putida TaxID=303 RepID=UPI0023637BE2
GGGDLKAAPAGKPCCYEACGAQAIAPSLNIPEKASPDFGGGFPLLIFCARSISTASAISARNSMLRATPPTEPSP